MRRILASICSELDLRRARRHAVPVAAGVAIAMSVACSGPVAHYMAPIDSSPELEGSAPDAAYMAPFDTASADTAHDVLYDPDVKYMAPIDSAAQDSSDLFDAVAKYMAPIDSATDDAETDGSPAVRYQAPDVDPVPAYQAPLPQAEPS